MRSGHLPTSSPDWRPWWWRWKPCSLNTHTRSRTPGQPCYGRSTTPGSLGKSARTNESGTPPSCATGRWSKCWSGTTTACPEHAPCPPLAFGRGGEPPPIQSHQHIKLNIRFLSLHQLACRSAY